MKSTSTQLAFLHIMGSQAVVLLVWVFVGVFVDIAIPFTVIFLAMGVFILIFPLIGTRFRPSGLRVTRFTARDSYSHSGRGLWEVIITGSTQLSLIAAYGAGLSQDAFAKITFSEQQLLTLHLGFLVLAAVYIRTEVNTLPYADVFTQIAHCLKDGSREIVVRQMGGRTTDGPPVSTPVHICVSRRNFFVRSWFWFVSNGIGTSIIILTVPIVMMTADTFTEAVFNAAAVRALPGVHRVPRSPSAPLWFTLACPHPAALCADAGLPRGRPSSSWSSTIWRSPSSSRSCRRVTEMMS
jgi:hypothetical protein